MKSNDVKSVLNVGGNDKSIALPAHFNGWEHLLLDIDPTTDADIICDARNLADHDADQFDAIYCSHNLEHYYRHDVKRVLAGFLHVLKPEGFAHIRVPDIGLLMKRVVQDNLDIEDMVYRSPAGPIHVFDVLYGWQKKIEMSGTDFFAHKIGFSERSLVRTLRASGFKWVYHRSKSLEAEAFAFENQPTEEIRLLLGLPVEEPAPKGPAPTGLEPAAS